MMGKTKTQTLYFCSNCGAQSPQWVGKCPACHEWNTYNEEIIAKEKKGGGAGRTMKKIVQPVAVSDITESDNGAKIPLGEPAFDRLFDGGVVKGGVSLIAGEPGIGKSTLMLQIALNPKLKTLYVSGEESAEQIKLRANRLSDVNSNTFVHAETNLENILFHVQELNPELLIIDSIQTLTSESLESAPGTVSQIRDCAAKLINLCKQLSIPVFLIGHITKDGGIAGPKVLEHMVDTVLSFEGDKDNIYRIVRTKKHRFGSTRELAIYEMTSGGLFAVSNPSNILLGELSHDLSGTAIASCMEGTHPIMVEVQALVSTAAYGTPQRSATGFDPRRLNMLLAVLEKRCGFRLGQKDVFLNITGGLKITDPALDLTVCAAILSSERDLPIQKGTCFAGEVGLSGEIRSVPRIETRVDECQKLGFKQIFISEYTKTREALNPSLQIKKVNNLSQVIAFLFN